MVLEQQASGTAMATAFLRALAAKDPRPELRGPDTLAELFLDDEHMRPVNDPRAREWVLKNRTAPGAYEFMIARTAFFDEIVRQGLQSAVPQIVFLGAGYDSRPYRFADLNQGSAIFEVDAAPTQKRKQECLQAAHISVPKSVRFVAVNFESQDVAERLKDAGYDPKQRSLFIWEGVTFYLTADAVDRMLQMVATQSAAGSTIAFDYASISAENLAERGAKELREHLETAHSGEPTRFGILAGQTREFLEHRGFTLVDHASSAEMRQRYLAGDRYPELASPPPLLCLAHAQVR